MNAITATDTLRIRASSLPSFSDCGLRTAVKLWPQMFRAAGFDPRLLSSSAGAIVGSATHAAAAFLLVAKMGDEIGNQVEAEHRAFEEMDRRISEEGVIWDDTTGNVNTAQAQTRRMVAAYRVHIVPKVVPVAVEQYSEAEFRPGVVVSGTFDLFEWDVLHDTKTGVVQRANLAQYGAYSILRRTPRPGIHNGLPVNGIVEDYLPRVRLGKEQPAPITTPYPITVAEQLAWRTIEMAADSAGVFRHTGNPLAFLPNPSSVLCSAKYCPAFDTAICRAHKGAALTLTGDATK